MLAPHNPCPLSSNPASLGVVRQVGGDLHADVAVPRFGVLPDGTQEIGGELNWVLTVLVIAAFMLYHWFERREKMACLDSGACEYVADEDGDPEIRVKIRVGPSVKEPALGREEKADE